MPLIGNQLASAENNSFRVLDDISNFTLRFDGSSSSTVSVANNYIALFQHPFVTGQRVTYSSGSGTTIGGLSSGSAYYIIKLDQNTFRLSTTYAGSLQNTNIVALSNTGTGITHSFNVAFDGINTKFKATYSNGTKCSISRAAQLDIAVNGVVQQPYDTNPPPNGFTIEADSTIVFSTAPLAGFTFWGKALTNAVASFETSDNSIDNFTGNGVLKNFTLSKTPANSQNVLVTVNGVVQYPSDATGVRSYSVNANVLSFDVAPANGSSIQVRYIGFAGATSSNVTGFYGRTGNVVLTTGDNINVGNAFVNGNLGVGVTNPSYLLTVNNTSQVADYVSGYFGSNALGSGESRTWVTIQKGNLGANYGGAIGGYLSQGVGGGLLLGIQNSNATPTEAARITTAGNLGIGTAAPLARLVVDGGGTVNNIAIRDDSIENHKSASDSIGVSVNYAGYNSGFNNFRNFTIWNGKGGQIAQFVGSTGNFAFNSGYGSVATAYGCRAWVNFNGTTAPGTIRSSGNVSSVTRNGTCDYTVNFTNAMPDANYTWVGNASQGNQFNIVDIPTGSETTYPTTTSLRINTPGMPASSPPTRVLNANPVIVTVAIFR